MRILLTGPSGFLGSALARYWTEQGHALYLLARPSSQLDRIDGIRSRVQLLYTASPEDAIKAVHQVAPDAIVHTACSYGRKGERPLDVLDANVRFGTALLQATLQRSSSPIRPLVFLNTATALESAVSLYALSKQQFSAWGATLACQSPESLKFIDIRLQQMYGPGDDRSKFTTQIIEACRSNEPRVALTPGAQRRDFIHIHDVVQAYDRILKRHQDFATSDAIDVGSGKAITIREFAEQVKQLARASTHLDFGVMPYRTHEAMLCVADTARLTGLGWRAQISLSQGLIDMLNDSSRVIRASSQ